MPDCGPRWPSTHAGSACFQALPRGTGLAPWAGSMVSAQPATLADVIRSLSAERSPACLLDSAGQFLFANDAYEEEQRSAEPAGGPLVGTSWLDRFQGEEVRRLHAEMLFRALCPPPGARSRPVKHVVERNSPTSSVLVQVRMDPVLLEGGPMAVAVTHTAVRERPIAEVYEPVDRPPEEYRDPSGAVAQCACCRRIRDPREEDRWDLLPEAVSRPPAEVAHVLCGMCRELHYGEPPPDPA
jgi:hypothetical protein